MNAIEIAQKWLGGDINWIELSNDEISIIAQALLDAVEALGFYASKETWTVRGHAQIDYDTKPILHDRGEVAREALAKIRGEQ